MQKIISKTNKIETLGRNPSRAKNVAPFSKPPNGFVRFSSSSFGSKKQQSPCSHPHALKINSSSSSSSSSSSYFFRTTITLTSSLSKHKTCVQKNFFSNHAQKSSFPTRLHLGSHHQLQSKIPHHLKQTPHYPLQHTRSFFQSKPLTQRIHESWNNGTNAEYIDSIYTQWKKDPNSVSPDWRSYFAGVVEGKPSGFGASISSTTFSPQQIGSIISLIRAYQVRGHLLADLDPLNLEMKFEKDEQSGREDLMPSAYGFSEQDMDTEFVLESPQLSGFLASGTTTLKKLIEKLKTAYCGTIGIEYMHIQDRERCNWIRSRIEVGSKFQFDTEKKKQLLDRILWAENFENFLATKFGKTKRFGLDGAEATIPGLKSLVDRASETGIESIVIGMPHRGRLNVLANVVRKPFAAIFRDFQGGKPDDDTDPYPGSGDVKYHLGTSYSRKYNDGRKIHLSLVANPSHLEAVNPVVEGKTAAKQVFQNDPTHSKSMSVLLHGDAAFAGQGIVYESLLNSSIQNFTTGGVIHVIVNNQVGFTTDPHQTRASRYCTDVAKAFNAPIFHVNGDDPEAVIHAHVLAVEWRQQFKKDVVIDLISYRKFGHNEGDEPRFTQPLMYQKIDKHRPVAKLYAEKLISEGVVTQDEVNQMIKKINDHLQNEFKSLEGSPSPSHSENEWLDGDWKDYKKPTQPASLKESAVSEARLRKIGKVLTDIPKGFTLHRQLVKVKQAQKEMIESGKGIDWGTAEALAFGTLLEDGNVVRITGQDVERGTFSHRHAVMTDQKTGAKWTPLHGLQSQDNRFIVHNSALLEYGGLGYEFGFALENPHALVLWEGQFGDFANGAQIMIDQFLSSGEAKWKKQNGVVLLLPHGYDGQGPEHSSARLERFLQLTDSDPDIVPEMQSNYAYSQSINMQICNITTAANYFHVLRRQILREYRKPLVIMSPKKLLRYQSASSNYDDFVNEKYFDRVIEDSHPKLVEDAKVRKLVFCSGQVYYDLAEAREARNAWDVAIVRIEQLAPFPWDLITPLGEKYPNAEVVWSQEEPKNMGAYWFMVPHLRSALRKTGSRGVDIWPTYAGRPTAAAPATGKAHVHKRELENLINDTFA